MKNSTFTSRTTRAAIAFFVLVLFAFCGRFQASAQIINLVAGTGAWGYGGDGGPAPAAVFQGTKGIVVDPATGYVYISDYENNCIRVVDGSGTINTMAGTPTVGGFSGDGGPATAAVMMNVLGLAIGSGNLYIADIGNHIIRVVNLSTGIINTFAGTPGSPGFSGDGGPAAAAQLFAPNGVAADIFGNVYISDGGNDRIRMVDPFGTITSVAGNGSYGYSGDGGPAGLAQLNYPAGVAVDPAGNYYIADAGNHVVREVIGGIIYTLAGNNTSGYSGDGGPATSAQMKTPAGVASDAVGNVFIADFSALVVRKVDASGIITTYAGDGLPGNTGDGGPATACTFYGPEAVATDACGSLYIGGKYNSNVREVALPCGHSCFDDDKLKITSTTDDKGNCIFTATASITTLNEVIGYQWQGIGAAVIHHTHATSDSYTFTLPPGGYATISVIIYLVDTAFTDTLTGPCCQATMSQDVKCGGGDGGDGGKGMHPATGKGGSAKNSATGGISIFPNPTNDMVSVSSLTDEVSSVAVIDVNGKQVANYSYNHRHDVTISLGNLAPGTYLLRVNGSDSKVVVKQQ